MSDVKKFFPYVIVTVVTLFMFSCSIFDYKMSLKIVDITQDPDSPPDQCGIARVELMVRNTGWGEIDYYDIYVDVMRRAVSTCPVIPRAQSLWRLTQRGSWLIKER
jgi:hypothetical protein